LRLSTPTTGSIRLGWPCSSNTPSGSGDVADDQLIVEGSDAATIGRVLHQAVPLMADFSGSGDGDDREAPGLRATA
jgi:hypothetical protein